jgi:hypothetical protein
MTRRPRFCAIAAFALLLFAVAPAAAQDGRPVGHVVQQIGPVTALSDNEPRVLFLGARVFPGDKILTGPGARVRVEFADGSTLSVGANSKVAVDRMVLDPNNKGVRGVISLVVGILRASLGRAPWTDGFEVETRAAIASVRSTDFIAEVRDDKTSVFVVDGQVAVAPTAAAPVLVDPGFGVDVTPDGSAATVKKWGQSRVDDVIARTQVP